MHSCPRCGGGRVTDGRLAGDGAVSFAPDGLRLVALPRSVGLDDGNAQGCADCGLVWAESEPGALRALLEGGGTEETRAWLARRAAPPVPPAG